MSDINIGQLSEAINDKCDRDMMNVDNASGADAVIDYQEPTSANNYTWYRKYASGWVEQGGVVSVSANAWATVSFPITMSNTNYVLSGSCSTTSTTTFPDAFFGYYQKTTTNVKIGGRYLSSGGTIVASWQISGMAAN